VQHAAGLSRTLARPPRGLTVGRQKPLFDMPCLVRSPRRCRWARKAPALKTLTS